MQFQLIFKQKTRVFIDFPIPRHQQINKNTCRLLENQLNGLESFFVVQQRRATSFPLFTLSCATAPKSSSALSTKSERSCDLRSFIERTFLSDFRKPFQSKSHFLQSSVSKWTKLILNIAPSTSTEFAQRKKCNSGQLKTAST